MTPAGIQESRVADWLLGFGPAGLFLLFGPESPSFAWQGAYSPPSQEPWERHERKRLLEKMNEAPSLMMDTCRFAESLAYFLRLIFSK